MDVDRPLEPARGARRPQSIAACADARPRRRAAARRVGRDPLVLRRGNPLRPRRSVRAGADAAVDVLRAVRPRALDRGRAFWVAYSGGPSAFADRLPERMAAGDRALAALEAQLEKQQYLVGDWYSLADIALYGYTHVAHEGGFDLRPYPAVRAWLDAWRPSPATSRSRRDRPAAAAMGLRRPRGDRAALACSVGRREIGLGSGGGADPARPRTVASGRLRGLRAAAAGSRGAHRRRCGRRSHRSRTRPQAAVERRRCGGGAVVRARVRERARVGEVWLAGDAAHMVAISDAGRMLEWTERGLELAESEPGAAYWAGPFLTTSVGTTTSRRPRGGVGNVRAALEVRDATRTIRSRSWAQEAVDEARKALGALARGRLEAIRAVVGKRLPRCERPNDRCGGRSGRRWAR